MVHPFRQQSPFRTYKGKKSDYRAYKDYLAGDFHHRCGYTDSPDCWFGGQRTFQIDHLKPWTKYPTLKTNYSNLVYCCSYVNRAKWDDDSPHYLDPCNTDLNDHLARDNEGVIFGKTESGKYMVDNMKLSLSRYAIIWNLERLDACISSLRNIVNNNPKYQKLYTALLEMFYDYTKKLHMNQ